MSCNRFTSSVGCQKLASIIHGSPLEPSMAGCFAPCSVIAGIFRNQGDNQVPSELAGTRDKRPATDMEVHCNFTRVMMRVRMGVKSLSLAPEWLTLSVDTTTSPGPGPGWFYQICSVLVEAVFTFFCRKLERTTTPLFFFFLLLPTFLFFFFVLLSRTSGSSSDKIS